MSIESVMPSNHLILCRPLLLLPSIFPSIRVFSNESALHIRWPKYWHFSFNISPTNEHPGLISFRMDWLDLLAVQGTLKSLLQHHSSKASILRRSPLFMVQLSHPYMTTGKTIALTRRTFVGHYCSINYQDVTPRNSLMNIDETTDYSCKRNMLDPFSTIQIKITTHYKKIIDIKCIPFSRIHWNFYFIHKMLNRRITHSEEVQIMCTVQWAVAVNHENQELEFYQTRHSPLSNSLALTFLP